MELYKFGWEPTETSLHHIEAEYICTREKLLACARDRRERARANSKTDAKRSAAYYCGVDEMFGKLIDRIENEVLFEHLEPCWVYSFNVGSHGAEVWLQHIGYLSENEDGSLGSVLYNANYKLLSIPCRMLSLDEFSQQYEVERGTVLQWIRRGKLRSVRRIGRDWQISELTELPGHKYVPGNFSWHDELSDLPDEFAYLREPSTIQIAQDKADPSRYNLTIYRMNRLSTEPHIEFREGLTAKEREKLELTLLSHPLVDCSSEHEKTW